MSLYEKFADNSITCEVVWDLKDKHLEDMGLSIGDMLKYNKARDKDRAEATEGK